MRIVRLILLVSMLLAGCSVVQWIPSSACEHVKYERHGADVKVQAECRL